MSRLSGGGPVSTPADHARQSADVSHLISSLSEAKVAEHPKIFTAIHQRLQQQLQIESGESWDD